MPTHYVDLEVCIGSKEEKMQFLVTGLGNEELILGYPWLSFEPQFNWASGAIDTQQLPIVIQLLDWKTLQICPTIVRIIFKATDEPLIQIQHMKIDLLCDGRDVHPTWARNLPMTLTGKMRVWGFWRLRFKENLR